AVKVDGAKPEGLGPDRIPIWGHDYDGDVRAPLAFSVLLVGGPYDGQTPQESLSRRRIFVCHPKQVVSGISRTTSDETACATKIVTTLARRAYRRSVTPEDVQTLLGFYKEGRANAGFDAGIRSALERLLVSPDFLFRIEADPANVKPGVPYRLSDVELASRLSFFLWSSIPDDELLDLAIRGKLSDAKTLDLQVRRMLADQRARTALVQNFLSQWLQVRNVWLLTPDASRQYPWFDDNLRTAFRREVELLFEAIMRQDRSVLDLLTADFTFVDERLAKHYGIPGVYGSQFRRVAVTEEARKGLLGKGAVLAVTSNADRTSPVVRGKWILDNLQGMPPPSPPANVPPLSDSAGTEPKSMREQMAAHRANPVCASCHKLMDPIGLALENFDAIGRWRTKDAAGPIDASGDLLEGTHVDGVVQLREALLKRPDVFVGTFTEKLMTYALERGVDAPDMPTVRSIVRDVGQRNYKFSTLVLGIVKSPAFQMRLKAEASDSGLKAAQSVPKRLDGVSLR
ncbi:MAG TPA: DUF1592 domain-containing protein, partial [Vicinamibacterales bacterium]|nr:DUF1592 domain-containing protein [Vicinamibacterales bacterium]